MWSQAGGSSASLVECRSSLPNHSAAFRALLSASFWASICVSLEMTSKCLISQLLNCLIRPQHVTFLFTSLPLPRSSLEVRHPGRKRHSLGWGLVGMIRDRAPGEATWLEQL